MRVFSLNTVALALILLSLTVPTGAVLGDHVGGTNGVVLSPHDGPNGKYASFDGDGNLSIDLGDDLNDDAVTTYDGVFDVTNNASHHSQVWISHNATEYVEFRGAGSGSIQGVANATVLAPGETVVVDITVDTNDASPGTKLIQAMEVHARHVDPPTTESSSSSSTGSSSSSSSPPTGTSREPRGTLVGSGQVRIQFDREVRSDESVRIERLGVLPPDPADGSLTAKATRVEDGPGAANASPASEERLRELDIDAAVSPGESFVVSGRESVFPSASSIDPEGRTAAVYDLTPPRRLADSAATIWVTVNRSRLDGADPSEAMLARRTDAGWQLLGTRTTRANETHVEVRSRTPGFSTFALFRRTDVTFEWTMDGRGPASGIDQRLSYEEPGEYGGTLTVTDASGRSDDTEYAVLVNDRPRVRVEGPESVEPGQPVTLRANVEDEFGATRITWEFEDGTIARGPTVTRSFDRGEHAVTVRAVDEYGAVGRSQVTIDAGGEGPLVQIVEFTLGVEGRLALVVLVSLAVIGALRWLDGRRRVRTRHRSR